MEVSNKFIKNELVIVDSNELALMNNRTKYKKMKENKQIESNNFNEVTREQNDYIQGLKNEIKIKSLKKFIKEKSNFCIFSS